MGLLGPGIAEGVVRLLVDCIGSLLTLRMCKQMAHTEDIRGSSGVVGTGVESGARVPVPEDADWNGACMILVHP